MLNQIILETRLVKSEPLKYSTKGTPYLKLVFVFSTPEKQGNEWQDKDNFIAGTIWGKRAEKLNGKLKPGSPLIIRAKLEQNRWEDKEGQKHSSYALVVEDLHFARTPRQKIVN
jgi:single-strand DNA-binding protein